MYLIVIMASILNISHLPLPLHNLLFDKFGMFLPPPRGSLGEHDLWKSLVWETKGTLITMEWEKQVPVRNILELPIINSELPIDHSTQLTI